MMLIKDKDYIAMCNLIEELTKEIEELRKERLIEKIEELRKEKEKRG